MDSKKPDDVATPNVNDKIGDEYVQQKDKCVWHWFRLLLIGTFLIFVWEVMALSYLRKHTKLSAADVQHSLWRPSILLDHFVATSLVWIWEKVGTAWAWISSFLTALDWSLLLDAARDLYKAVAGTLWSWLAFYDAYYAQARVSGGDRQWTLVYLGSYLLVGVAVWCFRDRLIAFVKACCNSRAVVYIDELCWPSTIQQAHTRVPLRCLVWIATVAFLLWCFQMLGAVRGGAPTATWITLFAICFLLAGRTLQSMGGALDVLVPPSQPIKSSTASSG